VRILEVLIQAMHDFGVAYLKQTEIDFDRERRSGTDMTELLDPVSYFHFSFLERKYVFRELRIIAREDSYSRL
jgi:hypothetical protein